MVCVDYCDVLIVVGVFDLWIECLDLVFGYLLLAWCYGCCAAFAGEWCCLVGACFDLIWLMALLTVVVLVVVVDACVGL